MPSIDKRLQNLFNATDVLAQFYDEIASFLDILYGNMQQGGYAAKNERLRAGTSGAKNLWRRLLGTATVVYALGEGTDEDGPEEEDEETEDNEKSSKKELPITGDFRVPFVSIEIFPPKTIPSVATLNAPMLATGAIGKIRFIEKKTGEPVKPTNPTLTLTNLVNVPVGKIKKKGDKIQANCWSPARMKKYRMEAEVLAFARQPLFEVDSQEKIKKIAEKLIAWCAAKT